MVECRRDSDERVHPRCVPAAPFQLTDHVDRHTRLRGKVGLRNPASSAYPPYVLTQMVLGHDGSHPSADIDCLLIDRPILTNGPVSPM
ncbi:hypothetical protein GCM10009662_48930 [Catellatospora coxensis]|uniref:Uncharacterized protein n=1 Tax=Catellatospora coxensis TaxID=310354 RepID=A0A8J3KSD1_9ACTN|nr:hypothetical protein Cco03nite_44630 [Catellatospora coxensis]